MNFGCQKSENMHYLLQAEQCMETDAESAMAILGKVENISKESDYQRALFALLWTQASHKCHAALDHDSLINVAVDYFTTHKNKPYAAKALLYKGLVHKLRKEVEKAVEAFAMSEQWFEGVEDDQYKALLHDHYGWLLYAQSHYEEALGHFKTALNHELKRDSTHYIVGCYNNVGKTFQIMGQRDSARYYYEKGLSYKELRSPAKRFELLKNYANLLVKEQKFEEAEKLLKTCEANISGEVRYSLYSCLATLYYEQKDYPKALGYAERMCGSRDSLILRGYYLQLYRIYAQMGEEEKSNECHRMYRTIRDEMQERLKTTEVALIPLQIEKEKWEQASETAENQRAWLMGAVVLLLTTAFVMYKRHARKRGMMEKELEQSKEEYAQEQQKMQNEMAERQRSHEAEIDRWERKGKEQEQEIEQQRKKQEELKTSLNEKAVEVGNKKSVIRNKDKRIRRMEKESETQKERISAQNKAIKELTEKENKARQTEKRLKEEIERQQREEVQKLQEQKQRIEKLRQEQRMDRLKLACLQRGEDEKVMALLDFLIDGQKRDLQYTDYPVLLNTLLEIDHPGMRERIDHFTGSENKRLIGYLMALGVEDTHIVKEIVTISTKTIKAYQKEFSWLLSDEEEVTNVLP